MEDATKYTDKNQYVISLNNLIIDNNDHCITFDVITGRCGIFRVEFKAPWGEIPQTIVAEYEEETQMFRDINLK